MTGQLTGIAAALLFVAFAARGEGSIAIEPDAPSSAAPKAGDVTGRIVPPGRVRSIRAVRRDTGKTFSPGQFNAADGSFAFRGLVGEADYDLIVETTDGRRFEGISLSFADERLLRLAAERRRQLGLPPEGDAPFTSADMEELLRMVREMKDFMEVRRVLYVRGMGRRATMLVELMRTRDFYDRKDGQVIWRIELWYFQKHFGGWERIANMERVLERRRIARAAWQAIDVEYYPQISVHVDAEGRSPAVIFTLPDAPDASRGRPAHTEVELDTRPHVTGLDGGTAPASRPAP